MRNHDRHLRVSGREGHDRQRVAEPDVDAGRESQLASDAEGQHPAVDEDGGARISRTREHPVDAIVVQRVTVHRGKQTHAPEPVRTQRAEHACTRVGCRRVHHGHADEPVGVPAHGGGDRGLVSEHTGHHRGAGDTMRIELADPSVG